MFFTFEKTDYFSFGCNVHIDEYIRSTFQFPSEFMSLMVQWTQQKLILVLWLWTRLRCRSWFCEHADDVAHDFVNMQKMSLIILWKRRRCRSWLGKHVEYVLSLMIIWMRWRCRLLFCIQCAGIVHFVFFMYSYTIKQTSLACQHLVRVNMQSLFHESRSWILIVRCALSRIDLHYSAKYNMYITVHRTHQQIRSTFSQFQNSSYEIILQ